LSRDLAGASVLIAGGSGVFGRAIARLLVDRGANLTLFSRDDARLRAAGLTPIIVPGDIALTSDCHRAVAAALDAYGRLDGVVNAAGVVAFGPLAELDDATLDRLAATNFLGPVRLMRAASAHLTPGSFIVNVTGVVAENPVANMAAYSASKAALMAADVALARELRRSKISVIDVRPPHSETGLASRPIAGVAPSLPLGLDPDVVASRIVAAIEADERDVPASMFQPGK
jgi:NAD(P)-dependent dehydrogenase (short-subunit alcohol dehydrogenase family)